MFGRKPFPPTPIPNSFWIEPGRVLAGEYPGAPSPEETTARLEALVGAGVSFFLNLTQFDELPPYERELPEKNPSGRAVAHQRKPVEDHGLPESPDVMVDILDVLDAALSEGHLVYVHCRAGIGRTNLVLGCWMRRQGMTGPAAIKRLNKLWKANARSATWPRIPEMHQEHFVLTWTDAAAGQEVRAGATQAKVLAEVNVLTQIDRYFGAILGLACGDAMGAPVQDLKPGEFAPLTDMVGGGSLELTRGAWTDDTSMMLCLAESLLEMDGFDGDDQVHRYLHWIREGSPSSMGRAVGVTRAVSKSLAEARWSGNPFSGSHDPKRWDAEALGRVGAVVLFQAKSPQIVLDWACDATRVTHQSPGVLDASRFYAALLLSAIRGSSKQTLLGDARELLEAFHPRSMRPQIAALVALDHFPAAIPADEPCRAAAVLHRVLWVLGETSKFSDGLLRIVNLGGPADVQGAVFGQLAGALYGVDSIPKKWRNQLLRPHLLQTAAHRLLAAAAQRKE